jgi:hypothetical protein
MIASLEVMAFSDRDGHGFWHYRYCFYRGRNVYSYDTAGAPEQI